MVSSSLVVILKLTFEHNFNLGMPGEVEELAGSILDPTPPLRKGRIHIIHSYETDESIKLVVYQWVY